MNSATAFTSPLPLSTVSASVGVNRSVCNRQRNDGGAILPVIRQYNRVAVTAVTAVPIAKSAAPVPGWQKRLKEGVVVEYYKSGRIHFGVYHSHAPSGTCVQVAELVNDNDTGNDATEKVSFDEIISVWSTFVPLDELLEACRKVEQVLEMDVTDRIRSLYNDKSKKNDKSGFNSSFAGRILYPNIENATVATLAAGRVISSETARFKRGKPGVGWKANPSNVVATRERQIFVNEARAMLDKEVEDGVRQFGVVSRPFLNALEICAASATKPGKSLARAMSELGYDADHENAGKLLRDLSLWQRPTMSKGLKNKTDKVPAKDSTFREDILESAKLLCEEARDKRIQWLRGIYDEDKDSARRNLMDEELSVYCVDDKNSNFLDDALSVEVLDDSRVRVCVHIADVSALIEEDSTLDLLARDRAQSMYLPLRPLHMLPPPVMEAASFSEKFPTEAITVAIEYDVNRKTVLSFDVFPSVVPPVVRLSYDTFDTLLGSNEVGLHRVLHKDRCRDLRMIANFAPSIAAKMDPRLRRYSQKRGNRKGDRKGGASGPPRDEMLVSGVRLVRRNTRGVEYRQAEVSTYTSGGAHSVVGALLGAAGGIIRRKAAALKVALPEEPGAEKYTRRCGTAPMRRYVDLATQRQLRRGLYGEDTAGAEEMYKLRTWLVKRRWEVEKTVNVQRKEALFEAAATKWAAQRAAADRDYAVATGTIGTVSVSKRGIARVGVLMKHLGVEAHAEISDTFKTMVQMWVEKNAKVGDKSDKPRAKIELAQIAMRKIFPAGKGVRILIKDVDRNTQTINAVVVELVADEKKVTPAKRK